MAVVYRNRPRGRGNKWLFSHVVFGNTVFCRKYKGVPSQASSVARPVPSLPFLDCFAQGCAFTQCMDRNSLGQRCSYMFPKWHAS